MTDLTLSPSSGSPRPQATAITSPPPVRRAVRAGFIAIALFFGVFGTWAGFAPISSAALAPGIVKVDTNRKTIQHPEGGIIRAINVRDGDVVREGQILMRLDALDADADRDSLRSQLDGLRAREARLAAQRDRTGIAFPPDLLARRNLPAIADAMNGQVRIFEDQAASYLSQENVLRRRIDQLISQTRVIEAQSKSLRTQIPSIAEELKGVAALFKSGLALKPRMLGLERQLVAAQGEIAANESRIQGLSEQVRETETQIEGLILARAREVSEELREVQTRRNDVEQQLRKVEARAGRREVAALQDGVVMNMRFFTPGGVVPAGGAILDLVPAQDKLVIEARVQPLDIDVVRPDLTATVRLVAYKQRTTPTLQGRVSRISADVINEERTGASYFIATIEVEAEELARAQHVKLYPGMPVDVSIVTGERTLIEYLLQPLTDSFSRGLRED